MIKSTIIRTFLVASVLLLSSNVMAAVYNVSDTSDTTAPNTIRWAINQANSNPGPDIITFSVLSPISIGSDLPDIEDQVTIEGSGTVIQANGWVVIFYFPSPSCSGSIIRSLTMYNNNNRQGKAIWIEAPNAKNIIIQGCAIGTDWSGITGKGFEIGIDVAGSSNIIGGNRLLGEGNVISGNNNGVWLWHTGTGNTVCGNIIGLNPTQSAAIPNGDGISIQQSSSNFIGLPVFGFENIISGNSNGILIDSTSSVGHNNLIQNNIIGLNTNGEAKPNVSGLHGGWNSIIGGDRNRNEGNIFSGNTTGMSLSDGNTVCGNIVGLNANQTLAVPNQNGIAIGGSFNTIGRPIVGYENIISGNSNNGIVIGSMTSGNIIRNNLIGITSNNIDKGNGGNGISLSLSNNNVMGGYQNNSHLEKNIISNNTGHGIYLTDSKNNTISGNYIGLDINGIIAKPNAGGGILVMNIEGGRNLIGGQTVDAQHFKGNIICAAGARGIEVNSSANTIIGNWLNVLSNGAIASQTSLEGIYITEDDNWIGLKNNGQGNLIANSTHGIYVSSSSRNGLFGNTIVAFSNAGITLAGGNGNKISPVITYASVTLVAGTSGPFDYIEVFKSSQGYGLYGGSLEMVGTTNASISTWSLEPDGLEGGEFICAIATDNNNNSSAFSENKYVINCFIHSIYPGYSVPGKTVKVTLLGEYFQPQSAVKLIRSGFSDLAASNTVVINSNKATCEINLANASPGYYDIQIMKSNLIYSLPAAFLVQEPAPSIHIWNTSDMGTGGATSSADKRRNLQVADGDNDGLKELFIAGLLQKILKYDFTNSNWSITPLPEASVGQYYSCVSVFDENRDKRFEVFGGRTDQKIMEFSGAAWQSGDLDGYGNLGSEVYHSTYGDGNNNGRTELYVACKNGSIYQFSKQWTWDRIEAGSSEGNAEMVAVQVGDGNNDGSYEIYGACANNKVYEFKYNGSSWIRSIVGFADNSMLSLALGDVNHDGENEIYASCQDGNIYQFIWTNDLFYNKQLVGALISRGLVVSDGDNDGEDELYCVSDNSHVYQARLQGNQWLIQDIGSAPVPIYALAIGDGDNDYRHEIYAIGEDNHVYQIKVVVASPTPTPTSTPIPNFDGQIISKNYIYAAPNPIRGHIAKIHVRTLQTAKVTVKLFTTTNKEVLSFDRYYSAGMQVENVNMSNLANGVYFLLVKAKTENGLEEKVIKKIALVK